MSTVSASYRTPTPANRYGSSLLAGAHSTPDQATQLVAVAGPSAGDDGAPWHPDHPAFWLGLILAGAVGLAYFSTTVRVGPASATVGVGKKK